MRYRHIVFDIDGTLINNEYAVLRSFQEILEETVHRTYPMEELSFCLGITGEDALKRMGIENIPEVLDVWIQRLRAHSDTVEIYSGMEELLEDLVKAGYRLGIATSKTREEFCFSFEKYPIAKWFGISICADDTREHKPTAGPLLKYMELSGAKREEILYVGDSVYDSQCAQNAGVDFALAVWGSGENKIPARYYPKRPLELKTYLQ